MAFLFDVYDDLNGCRFKIGYEISAIFGLGGAGIALAREFEEWCEERDIITNGYTNDEEWEYEVVGHISDDTLAVEFKLRWCD